MRIRDTANIGFAIKAGLLTELLKIKGKPCIPSNVPAEEINMFEKIRKEMVRKCGNLPLAISLLGGILSNKESIEKRKLVNKNISARTGVENLNDEIQQVLHLSYLDLPCYLKTCFLYTGMYKKDEVIPAIDPCVMWIAQGMISHHNHPNEVKLMEIAQGYLTELASRCACHWQEMRILVCKTRHLIIYLKSKLQEESRELVAKIVRSPIFVNDMEGRPLTRFPHRIVRLKEFKVLNTLSICGFVFEEGKLSEEISKLALLRILRFRNCLFDEISSSVKNLVYLHTLDLWNSGTVLIPNGVLDRMLRLRHLFLPVYYAI
ncbi:hypothetical protein SASPL_135942 [Salvia splendens]|uniref:NB-ARC domain-containing protein n=1 Tax=Salvia splendens TaxID=180675 RepID=A0A8X8WZW1_SALSN|nr:hypothetical protein SASPL_135942 [Salvia splendens]